MDDEDLDLSPESVSPSLTIPTVAFGVMQNYYSEQHPNIVLPPLDPTSERRPAPPRSYREIPAESPPSRRSAASSPIGRVPSSISGTPQPVSVSTATDATSTTATDATSTTATDPSASFSQKELDQALEKRVANMFSHTHKYTILVCMIIVWIFIIYAGARDVGKLAAT